MVEERISLDSVDPPDAGKVSSEVRLLTSRGPIGARFHAAESGDVAVLWVFGSGGGLGGPAGGVYNRLGQQLRARGVSSLELAYRRPGNLVECVLDVLLGLPGCNDWAASASFSSATALAEPSCLMPPGERPMSLPSRRSAPKRRASATSPRSARAAAVRAREGPRACARAFAAEGRLSAQQPRPLALIRDGYQQHQLPG